MNSLRNFALNSSRNPHLSTKVSTFSNLRNYTNNPRYPSDEKEQSKFESAHHDYLSSVLKTSSDEDWSSPAVQNHPESATDYTFTSATTNEQVWEDLVKDD